MLTVYGDPLYTADAAATNYYQQFTPTKNCLVKGVRSYIIKYNSPTYTSLVMKIYSNRSNLPSALIATSDIVLAADISTANNYWADVFFEFSSDVQLKANDSYHLVLNINGYTGNTSSHIAWARSFPDPIYQTGIDLTFEGLMVSPYQFCLISKPL